MSTRPYRQPAIESLAFDVGEAPAPTASVEMQAHHSAAGKTTSLCIVPVRSQIFAATGAGRGREP